MESFSDQGEKTINIPPPSSKGDTKSLIIAIALIAMVIGILSFSVGFILGKINLSTQTTQGPKEASPSATIAGWSIYVDKEALFFISHPKNWQAKRHDKSDYEGVKVSSKKGSVDLWLLVDQPFLIGEKHQKTIDTEEPIKVNVEDTPTQGTQYKYKAGNFFTVLVLKDTETSPQVTFWLKADDNESYDEALKIVESFKFLDP